MIPAHVTVFETDASWKAVWGVTRMPFSLSAQPTPAE
jgi:hypothetical protein